VNPRMHTGRGEKEKKKKEKISGYFSIKQK
jgi:hypothetical protein